MAPSRRILDVPVYRHALILACRMKMAATPTKKQVIRLLKTKTLYEEFQTAFDILNTDQMCLPWTVHEWIKDVMYNSMVIDYVLQLMNVL